MAQMGPLIMNQYYLHNVSWNRMSWERWVGKYSKQMMDPRYISNILYLSKYFIPNNIYILEEGRQLTELKKFNKLLENTNMVTPVYIHTYIQKAYIYEWDFPSQ